MSTTSIKDEEKIQINLNKKSLQFMKRLHFLLKMSRKEVKIMEQHGKFEDENSLISYHE